MAGAPPEAPAPFVTAAVDVACIVCVTTPRAPPPPPAGAPRPPAPPPATEVTSICLVLELSGTEAEEFEIVNLLLPSDALFNFPTIPPFDLAILVSYAQAEPFQS